jgi:Raf kinase inhibitor-like YbhB/YbcL family protein
MEIISAAFKNGQPVPKKYTCDGPNINPPLAFSNIPPQAKSLVLVIKDSNATPKPWIHWLVFNIPPTVTSVNEGSLPAESIQGYANGGTSGYEGPCPKYFTGEHTYLFELYALDKMLEISPTSDLIIVQPFLEKHMIEKAVLEGKAIGNLTKTTT